MASALLDAQVDLNPHRGEHRAGTRCLPDDRAAGEAGPRPRRCRLGLLGLDRIWLHRPFWHWNIEAEIETIRFPFPVSRFPVLAVQGLDDEYGTLEQIRGIARRLPQTQLLELPGCGHSPQRDQADAVIAAAVALIDGPSRD